MPTLSKLKTTVGNMHDSDPDDILQTRRHFKEIGIDAGEDDRPVIDKPLDNAIRTFQRELGLKEDGIMNPKGETENALTLALSIKEAMPPLPERKPQIPPLPERKEDALARKKGEKKSKMAGELGGVLFTGRAGRIPVKNKVLRQIIDKTVGKGEEFVANGIERLFEDHFINIELEKAEKERKEKINK